MPGLEGDSVLRNRFPPSFFSSLPPSLPLYGSSGFAGLSRFVPAALLSRDKGYTNKQVTPKKGKVKITSHYLFIFSSLIHHSFASTQTKSQCAVCSLHRRCRLITHELIPGVAFRACLPRGYGVIGSRAIVTFIDPSLSTLNKLSLFILHNVSKNWLSVSFASKVLGN